MLDRLRPFLFPALALAIAVAAWRTYGAQGLLLAVLMISFWVLLHFTKLMRLLRAAAKRPIGHVRDARALHRQLKPGMPLIEIVRRTHSLGQRRCEPDVEPQLLEWGDEQGFSVRCTVLRGRLSGFELHSPAPDAPEAPAAPTAEQGGTGQP